jgi:hypothetical protein
MPPVRRPPVTRLPLLLLPPLLVAAAPVPEGSGKPAYYATRVGTKWDYQLVEEELTEVLTAAEMKNGGTVVTVETRWRGHMVSSRMFSVSAEGVSQVGLLEERFDPPIYLLKTAARPGDRWQVEHDGVFGRSRVTVTARGEETVEVPAGRFRELKVEVAYVGRPEPRTTVAYYAPGVGLVKEVVRTEEGKWVTIRVLKRFTPGKE